MAYDINETFINLKTLFFSSLPFFHALRLENQVISMESVKIFPLNLESFLWVMYNLFSIFVEQCSQFRMIERFIFVLYDRVSIHENLNKGQWEMFC